MTQLSGKTAIITGGGSGVGLAIARALVMEDCNVLIASRRTDLLERAAKALNSLEKGRAIPVKCDIRSKVDIKHVVEKAKSTFPSIDILVNNAGLGVQTNILNCSETDWDLVIDTNLKGTFLMTQAVLQPMIEQQSGFILNIASQAARHGYPNAGPYCASKFGIVGLGEALQQEVRDFGIRVHSLCPALIQVPPPETPAERKDGFLQVDDLAATALFLFKQPQHVKIEDIGFYHI